MTPYEFAYGSIQLIDQHLSANRAHYRRASTGRLLVSLDEVIRAILEDDLIEGQGRNRVVRPWPVRGGRRWSPILIGPAEDGPREAA